MNVGFKTYYARLQAKELILPCNSGWRAYRFEVYPGVFKKIKDRVYSKEQLLKHLREFNPVNAYYSIAQFLNPTVINKRSDWIPENLFLKTDFVVDIDEKDLAKAKKIVRKAYLLLSKRFMKTPLIRFTGRGWHVVVEEAAWSNHCDPREREVEWLSDLKEATEFLVERGLEVDSQHNVTSDSRRIIKIPGTISHHGRVCRQIGLRELEFFEPETLFLVEKPVKLNEVLA